MKCNNRFKNMDRSCAQLVDQLNTLESNRHVWEGIITRVNSQVARLRELGVFHSTIVLGPLVMRRDYGVDGPGEGAEVVQAGLSSDCGLVAIFWDTEDLHEANKAEAAVKEWDAIDRARPLSECSALVRWLVAKESNQLLTMLIRRANLAS
jgi:hypothetical protein